MAEATAAAVLRQKANAFVWRIIVATTQILDQLDAADFGGKALTEAGFKAIVISVLMYVGPQSGVSLRRWKSEEQVEEDYIDLLLECEIDSSAVDILLELKYIRLGFMRTWPGKKTSGPLFSRKALTAARLEISSLNHAELLDATYALPPDAKQTGSVASRIPLAQEQITDYSASWSKRQQHGDRRLFSYALFGVVHRVLAFNLKGKEMVAVSHPPPPAMDERVAALERLVRQLAMDTRPFAGIPESTSQIPTPANDVRKKAESDEGAEKPKKIVDAATTKKKTLTKGGGKAEKKKEPASESSSE